MVVGEGYCCVTFLIIMVVIVLDVAVDHVTCTALLVSAEDLLFLTK